MVTETHDRSRGARDFGTRRAAKAARLAQVAAYVQGKILDPAAIVPALESLIRPGDRVALEGDNQKQADFLSRSLAKVDPAIVHDVHLLIATISRPEHLDLFELGIAHRLDFSLPARKACASRSCSRTASCMSAPSTPTSSSTRACSST